MKEVKKIKVKDLKDGDIFYCLLGEEGVEFLGEDWEIAGIDTIFIVDDVDVEEPFHTVYVNGGHSFCFHKDEPVYRLGHFSDICDLFSEKQKAQKIREIDELLN